MKHKSPGIAVLLCLTFIAGCSTQAAPPEINPNASSIKPELLVSAQGKLASGIVVYDDDGVKMGRVIKVDPDYSFPNGTRGGVLMDWEEKDKEDSYTAFFAFDRALIIPPDAKPTK